MPLYSQILVPLALFSVAFGGLAYLSYQLGYKAGQAKRTSEIDPFIQNIADSTVNVIRRLDELSVKLCQKEIGPPSSKE